MAETRRIMAEKRMQAGDNGVEAGPGQQTLARMRTTLVGLVKASPKTSKCPKILWKSRNPGLLFTSASPARISTTTKTSTLIENLR